MDMRSNDNNMDMMLGEKNSIYIERKLEHKINHALGKGVTVALPSYKYISQQIDNRNIGSRMRTTRPDRPLESMEMLSEEMNLRLSQVIDSLFNILQVQLSRAINSVINDRMIPEIQSIMSSMFFGQREIESGTPTNNQDISEKTNGLNTKLTKKTLGLPSLLETLGT